MTWWKDVRFGFRFGFAGSNPEGNFLQFAVFLSFSTVLVGAASRSRRSPSGLLCELRHKSPMMLFDVLARGGLPMALWLLIVCMPIVGSVCPHCFGALPSCSWESNSKCPSDTTITENIALVAAVSSATAIAGGKLFKMPAVMAQKYLRMFTSAGLAALLRLCLKSTAGTSFELTPSTTVAEAMQAIRNGRR